MAQELKTELKPGIEKPSNQLIYGASIVSIILSLLTVRRSPSIASFFGLWAPTILGLGILMKENRILEMNRRSLAV